MPHDCICAEFAYHFCFSNTESTFLGVDCESSGKKMKHFR